MGSQQSRSGQLNDILDKTATEIAVSVSSKGSGSYYGEQTVTIRGNTGDVNGVDISQVGSIDLSLLQNATVNAELQAQLTTGLTNAITQSRSTFPQINASSTSSDIRNIVQNEVRAKFGVEALATLQMDIKQKQDVDISYNQGNSNNIKVMQTAKGVGTLVNSLGSSIVQKITTGTEVSNTSDQKNTSWLDDILAIIIPLIIIAICGAGVFMLYKLTRNDSMPVQQELTPYQPQPRLQFAQ